jgi:peptide/nickel transport system permease protein
MKRLLNTLRELSRYPSAMAGLVIILILLGISIYAPIAIPYKEAVAMWRGDQIYWYKNPKQAPPFWVNFFTAEDLAQSFSLSTADGSASKEVIEGETSKTINMVFPFEFTADTFPDEMTVFFNAKFNEKEPYASVTWLTPDGRELRVGDFAIGATEIYRINQDTKLSRRLGGLDPQVGLFVTDPTVEGNVVSMIRGHYELRINLLTFEKDTDVDAEFVFYGQVHGWFGTDHLRRDLGVALLWGTPIALAFGLVAALTTTMASMAIAAIGVWFGGWVDELIQRVTEVNLVIPFLPILIMIGTLYNRSIVVIFGATILLSLFGGSIKALRATFMQIKESPYIEAARAYGASDIRIIFLYLIPRLVPLLIPALVTAIPGYVFLEASLAVLGLGDPVLPTWGKLINDASSNGALFRGLYYWVLEPAGLLMIAGLAFAMLGFSLDRIFNPRLRGT